MKFTALLLTVMTFFPLLAAQSALADPADINCTVIDSGGITLDISVDPTSGQLDGLTVYKLQPKSATPQPPVVTTNFPIEQISNFWVDLMTLKIHGVDTDTQQQSILIDYDRNLRLGRVTMNLPGYVLTDQILTCSFD